MFKTQKFIKEYNGKIIENYKVICSKKFNIMTIKFKNAIKKEFPKAKLIGFKPNHYNFSGVIELDRKCVYISYAIKRWETFNMRLSDSTNGILIQIVETADNIKDSRNIFCSFYDFKNCVEKLIKKEGKINEYQSFSWNNCRNFKSHYNYFEKFKGYFDNLYGQNLEILNWHLNGETESFDLFYESTLEYSKFNEIEIAGIIGKLISAFEKQIP